jgi:hypothetical protein
MNWVIAITPLLAACAISPPDAHLISEIFAKKQKIPRRETPKTPRFAERIFSVTLGGFGEVRRINCFLLGFGSAWKNFIGKIITLTKSRPAVCVTGSVTF